MPANKSITLTLLLAFALALSAGCANKAPTAETGGDAQTGPAQGPANPAGILALSERLKASRLATYASSTGKYTYFIGGALSAEYDTQTKVLSVNSLAAGEPVVCKYAPDGALFTDPKGPVDAATHTSRCNDLIAQLHQHLNR